MAENFAEMNQQKETKIPVFTVLKNNSIFKNIFFTEPPAPGSSSPCSFPATGTKNSGIDRSVKIFTVGRHQDCKIKLAHPSISRSHLLIRYDPSLQSLSVSDLSSVHGTWVCGKRIEPYVRVELQEGDTLQLGASSRIYRLHWVPRSGIDDFSNPYLPTINESEPLDKDFSQKFDGLTLISSGHSDEDEKEESHEGENCMWPDDHSETKNDGWGKDIELVGLTLTTDEDEREESHEGENCMCPDDHQSATKNDGWEEDIVSLFADMNMTTLCSKTMTVSSFTLDGVASPLMSKEDKIFESSLNCHESTQHQGTEMVENDDKKGEYRNLADDDGMEDLSFLFADMNLVTESNQWTPSDDLMPADEQSPFSCHVEAEKNDAFLKPVIPSAPLDPEGTVGEEEGNHNLFDLGIKSSPRSANTLNKYWNPPSALAWPGGAKPQFCYRDEEDDSNPLSTGITDTQTTLDHAKQNKSPNGSCISGKSQPKSPCTPKLRTTVKCDLRVESFSYSSLTYWSDGENEEAFTPDKENISPATRLLMSMKKVGVKELKPKTSRSPLKSVDSNVYKVVGKSSSSGKVIELRKLLHGKKTARSACKSDKKRAPDVYVSKRRPEKAPLRLLSVNSEEELHKGKKTATSPCMSDKEREPDVYVSKGWLDETLLQVLSMNSDCRNYEASNLDVTDTGICNSVNTGRNPVEDLTMRSACKSDEERKPDVYVLKGRPDKVPLQVLSVNSDGRNHEASNLDVTDTESCISMNNPHVSKPICLHNALEENYKKWTMVVDSACLLDKDSMKALQLMQGFPRTKIIIPRIVIMELEYLTKRCSLFRSTKQASAALQWIEDCMVNNQAGIHLQSAMEDKSHITPPTLFTSVLSFFSDYKTKFSAPFGGGLSEIASPSAENQILDCAVNLGRSRDNGQVILLSDNISLKIKAMAEGLLCESAKQFRESLVNPFSERFLWPRSAPRRRTWACNDVVVKNEYYNGQAQGLKLVLQ